MLKQIKASLNRKIARRVTKEYPVQIETFETKDFGSVQFANWQNPLVQPKVIQQETLDFFKKYVKQGDLVVDIGANIGLMSVHLGLLCSPEGLCLAFDPNPFVFKILSENAALNPDKTNIKAFNFAISETNTDFYYHSSEASFNNGGISKEQNSKHGKFELGEKIKGIVLADFLHTNFQEYLPKLSLIKIDTEGYDKEIIKSMIDLLRMYMPVVITECFGKNTATERYEQYNLLKSLGYKLYYFKDFVADTDMIEITKQEDMFLFKHFDLIAMP